MSGKAKFTPGPWIFGVRKSSTRAIAIGNTNNYGVWPDVTGREEMFDAGDPAESPIIARANGHLIAAAPDLYEAASEAYAFLAIVMYRPENIRAEGLATLALKMNAALKKARGEP